MIEEDLTVGDIGAMLDQQHRVVMTAWKASNCRFTSKVLELGGIKYSEMRPESNRAGFTPALLLERTLTGANLVSSHSTAVITVN